MTASRVLVLMVLFTLSTYRPTHASPRTTPSPPTAVYAPVDVHTHPTIATGTPATSCPTESSETCQAPDQGAHGPAGAIAANATSFRVADNFVPTETGVISSVCWWGAYFDFDLGEECIPSTVDTWDITYFVDTGNGTPTLHAGPITLGAVDRVPTGLRLFDLLDEYSFHAAHENVPVEAGRCYWIEIHHTGLSQESCLALWSTAPPGDTVSRQTGPGAPPDDHAQYDLAWCLDVAVEADGCFGECIDCCFACSAEAIPEGEPSCTTDYVDMHNPGCSAHPEGPWQPIELGDTICGEGGSFLTQFALCDTKEQCTGPCGTDGYCTLPQAVRDSDWYELFLPVPRYVRIELAADTFMGFGLVDIQSNGCDQAEFIPGTTFGAQPCASNSIELCLEAGLHTLWVGAGTVSPDNAPCGATHYELTVNLADAGYSPGVCPNLELTCPSATETNCQLPDQIGHGKAGIIASTSDANPGFFVYEDIRPVEDALVDSACWWGIYVSFNLGREDCSPGLAPDSFTLAYYADDGTGLPGALIGGPFSQADGTLTLVDSGPIGEEVFDFQQYGYSATHPPVQLDANTCVWVSIYNDTSAATEDCLWLWATAPGNGRSVQEILDDGLGADDLRDFDLALCTSATISQTGCSFFGACCGNVSGTCVDGVSQFDCAGRFVQGASCDDLDPPCGAGACCQEDGSCTDTLPDDCSGTFQYNALCGEAICNVANSCGWDNGAPVDASGVPSQYAPGEFHAAAVDSFTMAGIGQSCQPSTARWFVRHADHQGQCPDGSHCAVADDSACNGNPAACLPGHYANTPDDYVAINVVVYANDEARIYDHTPNLEIPQSADDFGMPLPCGPNGICAPDQTCIDNNGDGMPECALAATLNIADSELVVTDIDLDLSISHTWQGDLVASLEHVASGTRARVINRAGSSQFHDQGGPFDGYSVADFGNAPLNIPLRLNDQALNAPAMNLYDGAGEGIERYTGPARSGGGNDPIDVLGAFNGLPADGMWRLYVSDDFGVSDSGTLNAWSLRINSSGATDSHPAGHPEHVMTPLACKTTADCTNQGAVACACVNGTCVDDGQVCAAQVPTGRYADGQVCQLSPESWTWAPLTINGQRLDDAFDVRLDIGACNFEIVQNMTHFLEITAVLPFQPDQGAFYATEWMRSTSVLGSPALRYVPAGQGWQPLADGADLAFELGTSDPSPQCANSIQDCADRDHDLVRDDACVWWQCSGVDCIGVETTFGDIAGKFGNCQPDGAADANDRFATMNCFANQGPGGSYPCEAKFPDPPPLAFNSDVGGEFEDCRPDGRCDTHDTLHVLNAFEHTSTCVCPLDGPAPDAPGGPPITVSDRVHLDLQSSSKRARPGSTIEVDVILRSDLADLRAYQLHAVAVGGRRGMLELIDISTSTYAGVVGGQGVPDTTSIALRTTPMPRLSAGHAAPGLGTWHWRAFNLVTGQVMAGLDTPGGPAVADTVLATFTFKASADARGVFLIDLENDPLDPTARTFLFPTAPYARIEIASTSPAVISIEPQRE